MICPVCELANGDGADACAECGKRLFEERAPEPELEPLPGHERTQVGADDLDVAFALAALETEGIAPVEGLEPTQLFDPRAEVPVEPLALDGAQPERAPAAPVFWTDGVLELESGRDEDGLAATPAPPENGPCPWCGFPGRGAVCNNCGRRRNRFTREPERPFASSGETLLCPICFTRVAADARCSECLAPLPRLELL